jgi:hypothetical protein
MTTTTDNRKAADMVRAIDAFDSDCARREHVDTDDGWALLNEARALLIDLGLRNAVREVDAFALECAKTEHTDTGDFLEVMASVCRAEAGLAGRCAWAGGSA